MERANQHESFILDFAFKFRAVEFRFRAAFCAFKEMKKSYFNRYITKVAND